MSIEPKEPVETTPTGCCIHLYARPRASRNKITGLHDGRVKVQITAPPVDGEANAALIDFFASILSVAKSKLELVSGQTGKRKTIAVEGVSCEEALEKLGLKR